MLPGVGVVRFWLRFWLVTRWFWGFRVVVLSFVAFEGVLWVIPVGF